MKLLILFFIFLSLEAKTPSLFLLDNYSQDMNITSWYMSEKLDGVRAYWDGEKLISRSGKVFSAPEFFIKDFPSHELDGELWSKRADFSHIVSIVNRKYKHEGWRELTYNIFEVPNKKGGLIQRLEKIKESQYIKVIQQIQIKNKKKLDNYLKKIEKKNGEGIVIRDGSLEYYTGRNKSALKLKNFIDSECKVVGHNKGRKKYLNIMGSLSCKLSNGKTIKIGTGFTENERINPPNIGDLITFKYYGFTSLGNPRFPVFLRIKRHLK